MLLGASLAVVGRLSEKTVMAAAAVDRVRLVALKERENENESERLVDKYEPTPAPSPPEEAEEEKAEAIEEEDALLSGEREKPEKKRAKGGGKEKERALRAVTSFLPRNKKADAKKFLALLLGDPDIEIRDSLVFHKGLFQGHVTGALARLFLPRDRKRERFFNRYLPSGRRPSFDGHLAL